MDYASPRDVDDDTSDGSGTMTAYTDVLSWMEGRPWWQQQAVVRAAAVEVLEKADFEAWADALLGDEPARPEDGWLAGAQQPAELSAPSVRLSSIFDVTNVNRLAANQRLTFGLEGLTVVYGNNGSGKSGYARLVKNLVRTRHQEQVLPDIFTTADGLQDARLEYRFDDQTRQAALGETPPSELLQVSYYDERCGDMYVTTEGEATYRPSALRLLDELISVCDGVRAAIDERLSANALRRVSLPALNPTTRAGLLLSSLSDKTTNVEIEEICAEASGAEEEIERARNEEARLRATDPAAEARRLARIANALDNVANHLNDLETRLGTASEERLRAAEVKARATEASAAAASKTTFGSEPLDGVGSAEWQALWSAAERYSVSIAYPDVEFPATDDSSHCVLCQQTLNQSAQERLRSFHRFMADDTQEQADTAKRDLVAIQGTLSHVDVEPAATVSALATLEEPYPELHADLVSSLARWNERKDVLTSGGAEVPEAPTAEPQRQAMATATQLSASAAQIDASAFQTRIQELAQKQLELTAAQSLANAVEDIQQERDRIREETALKEARRQTDTRAISRVSGDLTAKHVTVLVQDRFSRESQDLRVDSVTMLGSGVQHGAVMHKPGFVGAVLNAELPQVLSEGEQTALGLAGFFVEAHLDSSRSSIVLDDPVTSLDHLRRDVVAERLARFAQERQVIVFTHDVSFAASLKKSAKRNSVSFTERSIERSLDANQPGMTREKHPWTLKDTPTRIDQLRADLARMRTRSVSGEWTQEDYEDAVSKWASRLSQTWERIISQEIADQLFDRSTLHVSVTMMKVVQRISESDNQELQDSYNLCSSWTRHDQDMALNYSPPSLDDLERELERVHSWHKRIKGYRNNSGPGQ